MVINNLNTIYPAKQSWPDAIISLKDISLDTKDLRLPAGVKHLEYIRKLVKLERLWCFNINESNLEYISNCESLKCLYIENLKTNNIVNLQKLKLLKTLSINTCSKIISSQAYNKFEHLQELAIIHFKNLHEIESISVLMSLKALVISGSMWSVMSINTFEPLSKLTNLKLLEITNVKSTDKSLSALAELKNLNELLIANFFPMEEFARLSIKLPNTKCTWFKPYVPIESFECKNCGSNSMVMLTGKGKSIICSICNSNKLNKHLDDWEKIIKETV